MGLTPSDTVPDYARKILKPQGNWFEPLVARWKNEGEFLLSTLPQLYFLLSLCRPCYSPLRFLINQDPGETSDVRWEDGEGLAVEVSPDHGTAGTYRAYALSDDGGLSVGEITLEDELATIASITVTEGSMVTIGLKGAVNEGSWLRISSVVAGETLADLELVANQHEVTIDSRSWKPGIYIATFGHDGLVLDVMKFAK